MNEDDIAKIEMSIANSVNEYLDLASQQELELGIVDDDGELFVNARLISDIAMRATAAADGMGEAEFVAGAAVVSEYVTNAVYTINSRISPLHVNDILGEDDW